MKKIKNINGKLLSYTAVAAIIGAGLATAAGVSAFGGGIQGDSDSETREEIRSALESGDYDTWSEIVRVNVLSKDHFNEMVERHTENMERHDALEEVLAANDFEAWSDFIAESDDWGRGRLSEVVTDENFPTFVALHEAMEAGNLEKAKQLREALGLNIPMHDGSGQGFRKQNGNHQRGYGMGIGVRTGSSNK